MESVSKEMKRVSSSGEETVEKIRGVLLDDVLKDIGESKSNYSNIRFTAGDGYAVTVPCEIVGQKDIVLAYAASGEILDDSKLPLMIAIDDVRSMYYVSNLIEIEFSNEETKEDS